MPAVVVATGTGEGQAPAVQGTATSTGGGPAVGTGVARPPTVQGGTVSTLPAVVTHGAVKAWLGSGVNVSPDADGYADLIPDVGTVTFTPNASVLTFPTASPAPLILTPRTVVCTLDSDGYLIGTKTGGTEKLVRLIAGDWTVSYQLTGVTLSSHKITVVGGVTIDLAEVMPT
jgi:hypothetical protein